MVNTDDFVKRLENVLEYYNLNASAFADKIGVQRSSMSHLLSGRNKPSLDFILKILEVFPEVDLYWILNGKGIFPKSLDSLISNETPTPPPLISYNKEVSLFSDIIPSQNTIPSETLNKEIVVVEKIVFFYSDGSFKEYKGN
jgi:transcriptional regulator with XRE-family HTH domain